MLGVVGNNVYTNMYGTIYRFNIVDQTVEELVNLRDTLNLSSHTMLYVYMGPGSTRALAIPVDSKSTDTIIYILDIQDREMYEAISIENTRYLGAANWPKTGDIFVALNNMLLAIDPDNYNYTLTKTDLDQPLNGLKLTDDQKYLAAYTGDRLNEVKIYQLIGEEIPPSSERAVTKTMTQTRTETYTETITEPGETPSQTLGNASTSTNIIAPRVLDNKEFAYIALALFLVVIGEALLLLKKR